MLIDWFTVIAQTVNFLVLVWLMKRYLYKPILAAIDTREARIADAMQRAANDQQQAQQARETFQQQSQDIAQRRSTLLETAIAEARVERQHILDEARHAADALRIKLETSLQEEHASLSQALLSRAQHEVFAIARQTLADLASAKLETQIVEAFMQRLHSLNSRAQAELAAAIATSVAPVIVRSALPLAQAQQSSVAAALQQVFALPMSVQFETAQSLICGIELQVNGQKLAWSIDEYLKGLHKHINAQLAPQTQQTSATAKTGAADAAP